MKLIALFILISPSFALAAVTKLASVGGSVETLAIGKPSFIKIRGKGEAPKGELIVEGKKASGNFEFSIASLDTGIELRNEHMRDNYLHVKDHPTAKTCNQRS